MQRKSIKRNQLNQIKKRISRKNKRLYNLQGGVSFYGIRSDVEVSTLERFANYWYNYMKRNVWYSSGQDGYYFSNLTWFYMSQTHTHIYLIEDLDDNPDGRKRVHYVTKVDNVHRDRATVELDYLKIGDWLTELNRSIGADRECCPTPEEIANSKTRKGKLQIVPHSKKK